MVGGSQVFLREKMCSVYRNAYWMLPERDSLCPEDQARAASRGER